ncbi:MAG: WG repeat-containing protein [Bacteroidales bacterium]|jgi:hypothetical protein|nr:WG repeat-containing protein [Bacteroidales bacterium]
MRKLLLIIVVLFLGGMFAAAQTALERKYEIFEKDGLYGYKSRDNKYVYTQAIYDFIKPLTNSDDVFAIVSRDGKQGIIYLQEREMFTDFKYDYIGSVEKDKFYPEGIIKVKIKGKTGYLKYEETFEDYIPPKYDEILSFGRDSYSDKTYAIVKNKGLKGIVFLEEMTIIKPQYIDISDFYMNYKLTKSKRGYGIINVFDEKEVVKPVFDTIYQPEFLHKHVMITRIKNRYGYILLSPDIEYATAVKPIYVNITQNSEGQLVLKKKNGLQEIIEEF